MRLCIIYLLGSLLGFRYNTERTHYSPLNRPSPGTEVNFRFFESDAAFLSRSMSISPRRSLYEDKVRVTYPLPPQSASKMRLPARLVMTPE